MSATSTIDAYRFLFRGRIMGNFEWICPCCGYFHASAMRPAMYTVQCRHAACQRIWGLGHVLHELPMARRTTPDDTLIPQNLVDTFPEGDVGRWWRTGKLLHCVHTHLGSLAVPDITLPALPPRSQHDR